LTTNKDYFLLYVVMKILKTVKIITLIWNGNISLQQRKCLL
jgi:hypothetical protein